MSCKVIMFPSGTLQSNLKSVRIDEALRGIQKHRQRQAEDYLSGATSSPWVLNNNIIVFQTNKRYSKEINDLTKKFEAKKLILEKAIQQISDWANQDNN